MLSLSTTDQTNQEPSYSFAQEIAAKNKEIKEEYLKITVRPANIPPKQGSQPKPKKDPKPSE